MRAVAVIVLFVVAAIPRFYELGQLSLSGDEELTALSARSAFTEQGASMASGMPYYRGYLFTLLNAGTIELAGNERESTYRLPAAVFGTLTPPALFLTGTAFVSPPVAFVAGGMLAVSEWHIARSRVARMYPPFLFFFILTGFFFWKWATEGRRRDLVLGLSCFAVASSLQILGIFAVQFALVPLALKKKVVPNRFWVLAICLGVAGLAYLLDENLVASVYQAWALPGGFQLEGMTRDAGEGLAGLPTGPLMLLAVVGALVGGWLGRAVMGTREKPAPGSGLDLANLAGIGAGAAAGACVGAGLLWGAALCLAVLFLIQPHPFGAALRDAFRPFVLLVAGAFVWTIGAVAFFGFGEGIRRLVIFPFPYLAFFWYQFPGLVVLFLAAALWLVLSPSRGERPGLTMVVMAVLLPMAAVGLLREWAGTRYLIQTYPYLLLAGAAVLFQVGRWIAGSFWPERRTEMGLAFSLIVVLAGLTGGHGIYYAVQEATLEHGEPVNEYVHDLPFRPDHRGPGEFLRENLEDGDIVIAEDVSQQIYYAGQADYWLRRPGDARPFLFADEDGRPRDIYAGAVLVPTRERVEEAVRDASGRAWLVTSGETWGQRGWYLSDEQREWLEQVEELRTPAFVGADDITSVYCVNC